ncbi:MAG: hypothetical protein R3D32_11265 [Nitratireductor sp.]
MIWRGIYYALCTLVVAGIVHIAVVLLVPEFGTKDAYAMISGKLAPLDFKPVNNKDSALKLSDIDPFFSYGACSFELSNTSVKMTAPKIDTFWSATLVDEDGTVIYSLNSRTAIDNKLDLMVLNPVQILRLREAQPAEAESAIIIEADVKAGFIVLRVLRPNESWNEETQNFLKSVKCEAYDPGDAVPAQAPASKDGEESQPSG